MHTCKDVSVLVVDDDAPLRKAILFDLKKKGLNIFEAGNGIEALEIVKNKKIDLVLSDVRMPGGDGIALLENIKAIDPMTPVVMFVTGFTDILIEDAYDKGADAVFAKPFDRQALLSAVSKGISSREELWGARTSERVEVDFNVDLHFSDMDLAIHGRVLNLGRGGIFVALDDKFPETGARTRFVIEFERGKPSALIGNGIVRWVRTQASESRPAGCGIEFDFLTEQIRKDVIELINRVKSTAFIPKS